MCPKKYGMWQVRAGSTGKVAELILAEITYAQIFKQHYRDHQRIIAANQSIGLQEDFDFMPTEPKATNRNISRIVLK